MRFWIEAGSPGKTRRGLTSLGLAPVFETENGPVVKVSPFSRSPSRFP